MFLKTIDITARSIEEATNTIQVKFTDLTRSYTRWLIKHPNPSEKDIMSWAEEKMANLKPDEGVVVTIQKPIVNKLKRPYSFENVKVEEAMSFYTTYDLYGEKEELLLSKRKTSEYTKPDAIRDAKKLLADGTYQGNITITMAKHTENPVIAKINYKPSEGTRLGSYKAFIWVD